MFFRVLSYIKFLFKSKNHHGVHSPFIFDFVTKCLYKRDGHYKLSTFYKYRQDLISNNSSITITDFGAGSKIFSSNTRKISQIAKYAGISSKRGKLLLNTVQYFNSKNILEIGTSLGIGTSALSLAASSANITTLEGCKETASVALKMFEKYNLENIQLILGNFKTTLPKTLNEKKYDLIYFDGNHTKQATLNYFYLSLQSIHNDSVFIFDDIHWSLEMEEAWREIKNHEAVKVTIDTFHWGFVFFRKEQKKEHFTIRV